MSTTKNAICSAFDFDALLPRHWSGQQARLACELLLSLHDAICDRYRYEILEAMGEPLPYAHYDHHDLDVFDDDDLPF